jgi:hypothetical protein
VRWIATGVVFLIAGVAVDSSPGASQATTPEAFLKATLIQIFRGQYERGWSTIHPAQQKLIPRRLFVNCARRAGLGEIRDLKVVDRYHAGDKSIPGTKLKANPEAVKFRIRYYEGGEQIETVTFRTVKVRGTWRWIIEATAMSAYKAGHCV